MKRNGFTFIEVLGVITLLALISVIVLVVVDKSLKDSKDTLSQAQIENIKSAASMWRTDNIEKISDDGYYVLSLGDLIDMGYIDDVVDPNSKNKFDNSILIDVGMNGILVGEEANNYVSNLYGCNNSTVFCINDRSDLEKLATEVIGGDNKSGKIYKLIKNIDLGGKFDSDGNPLEGNNPWTPIGSGEKPFSGTFDGTGHIITGMYIDSSTINTGLFSVVSGGTIKNLGIEDSYVKSNEKNTGTFVGYLIYDGIVQNCYNSGTVVGKRSSGGLVGLTEKGNPIIKNCYNTGDIYVTDDTRWAYKQFGGGIIGFSNGTVQNCYNTGKIHDGVETGGIIGGTNGFAKNLYNLGEVNITNVHGGVVGTLAKNKIENTYNSGNLGNTANGGILGTMYTNSSQQLINNYYLNTTADFGILYSDNENYASQSDNNATPLSAGEMPSVISVINGDGAFVPDTKGINNGYPILSWQQ